MKPKVFVASYERYDLPFYLYGELDFVYANFYRNPRQYRLVVLTGGEDINPSIYGHNTSKSCGYVNIRRDQVDLYVAYLAIRNSIPIVGICRGAQLLNSIAGGHLVQHCKGHGVWHNIRTVDGELIWVSSTHHQMMLPPRNAEVLAWADPVRSTEYLGGMRGRLRPPEKEVDVVYLPNINALAMQYHPEYMPSSSAAFSYATRLVEKKLGVNRVRPYLQDDFVSLPKPEITDESIAREEALVKTLNKKALAAYNLAKWEKDYLDARIREYMALLYTKEESEDQAKADLKKWKDVEQEAIEAAIEEEKRARAAKQQKNKAEESAKVFEAEVAETTVENSTANKQFEIDMMVLSQGDTSLHI